MEYAENRLVASALTFKRKLKQGSKCECSFFIYLKGGEYMTVGDIITRTTSFKGYKYWYGGKGVLLN